MTKEAHRVTHTRIRMQRHIPSGLHIVNRFYRQNIEVWSRQFIVIRIKSY